MKKLITILTLALITACPLARAQNSLESDPAYLPIDKVLDLKATPPQVNVNLPRFLLKDALSGLTNLPNKSVVGGNDLADLVKDVKLIRVVVFDVPKTNRAVMDKGLAALRKDLDAKWTSIANVQDKDSRVGVYAMGDPSGESMAGVAVLVSDGGNVIIVNIVGHVSIGKLMTLAAQMHKLPPELLQQLQGIGGQASSVQSDKKSGSSSGSTNPPVESSDANSKDTTTVK